MNKGIEERVVFLLNLFECHYDDLSRHTFVAPLCRNDDLSRHL